MKDILTTLITHKRVLEWGYRGTPRTVRLGPWPASFRACTATVKTFPLTPGTLTLVLVMGIHVPFPTRYLYVTEGAPPKSAGAAHVMRSAPLCGEAFNAVTAPGLRIATFGTTGALAADGTDVPAAFVAVTEKVYSLPFVRPETTQVSARVVEHVCAPGDAVTVYPVTDEPPSLAGACQLTVT